MAVRGINCLLTREAFWHLQHEQHRPPTSDQARKLLFCPKSQREVRVCWRSKSLGRKMLMRGMSASRIERGLRHSLLSGVELARGWHRNIGKGRVGHKGR
jgi:hypothetical protein